MEANAKGLLERFGIAGFMSTVCVVYERGSDATRMSKCSTSSQTPSFS
jgi:hypothetical protein